jgi:prefoldin subunit 5
VITDAIKYVQEQMDHLNKTEKALPKDIKENNAKNEDIDPQETNNDIF